MKVLVTASIEYLEPAYAGNSIYRRAEWVERDEDLVVTVDNDEYETVRNAVRRSLDRNEQLAEIKKIMSYDE